MVDGYIVCDNAQGVGRKRYAQARLRVPRGAHEKRGDRGLRAPIPADGAPTQAGASNNRLLHMLRMDMGQHGEHVRLKHPSRTRPYEDIFVWPRARIFLLQHCGRALASVRQWRACSAARLRREGDQRCTCYCALRWAQGSDTQLSTTATSLIDKQALLKATRPKYNKS